MSPVNRHRLNLTGLITGAFVAGLLLAGVLNVPRLGNAQQVAQQAARPAASATSPRTTTRPPPRCTT